MEQLREHVEQCADHLVGRADDGYVGADVAARFQHVHHVAGKIISAATATFDAFARWAALLGGPWPWSI